MSAGETYAAYQFEIYTQGLAGRKPEIPVRWEDLEARAREKLPPEAYWYVAGGAGEDTMRANLDSFRKWRIVPRVLRDVAERELTTRVLGTRLKTPLLLAPIGVQEIVHPDAELAVARAAASLGVPFILSSAASKTMEQVAEAMGNAPRWFQLYWPRSEEITRSFLQRAEDAGYGAVVVTLDTKMMAWRERDLDGAYLPFLQGKGLANYLSDPAFRAQLKVPPEEDMGAAIAHWSRIFSDHSQTWDDLQFLLDNTRLPLVLKGILHPEDARRAADLGIEAVIVSNHGGRQVAGAVGALDALLRVKEEVGDRMEILFDSGIRNGADMVKALALGAKAVCLGRPYIWGLALAGEAGVREVLRRMLAEFDLTMGCAGFADVSELNATALERAAA